MKKYLNNNITKTIAIIICAIFTFGGAVNMGWSGFAMAVPFMVGWAYLAWLSGRTAIITSLCLFVAIIPFYILRLNESSLFFPANGKEIVLNENRCFTIYPNNIIITDIKNEVDCLKEKNVIPAIQKSKIVPKGTRYVIERTEVSHVEMGESYNVIISDKDGDGIITVFSSTMFDYVDGKPVTQDSLINPYFYYPSLLMAWPLIPIYILNYLSQGM